jgi:hypothetical protein
MARYQLRQPSPVKVVPRNVRRGGPVASTMPAHEGEEEEEEGPESPDSPASSPSTVGGSESEDSDSDDEEEPASPVKSSASPTAMKTLVAPATRASSMPTSMGASNSLASTMPALTVNITSQRSSTAMPQITDTTLSTRVRSTVTSTITQDIQSGKQKQATATSVPRPTAESEMSGDDDQPEVSFPQQEERPPIMTRSAAVAATTLGVLGMSFSHVPTSQH